MTKKFKNYKKESPNWTLNPSYLNKVIYDNKYYLYIDESGNYNNSHLSKIRDHMNDPESAFLDNIDEAFSLTGILIKGDELKKVNERFISLKRKTFGSEFMNDGRAIVIHRTDFGKKIPFKKINSFDKKKFELEIEKIFGEIDFKVFSVCNNKLVAYCVDKLNLEDQRTDHKIYEKAIEELLIQVAGYLNPISKKFVCIFESVNRKHDIKIHNHFVANRHRKYYGSVKNLMFSSKSTNNEAVVGLEIADYFSMVSFRWTLSRDYLRVTKKFNNFPNHYGNGMKIYGK